MTVYILQGWHNYEGLTILRVFESCPKALDYLRSYAGKDYDGLILESWQDNKSKEIVKRYLT
jgi:hypothetical protein